MSNIDTLMCTFGVGGRGGGDGRNKEPTTEYFKTSHSVSICNRYLYNIIYRRFVQVPGFKTVGTCIKNSLFLSDISPEQYQGILEKLNDPLTDMNEDISTCSLAVLLYYTASFFCK